MAPTGRVALLLLSLLVAPLYVLGSELTLKVTGPTHITDVSDLILTTTLSNTGTDTLTIIREPRSAVSETPAQTFAVTHASGQRPAFTGIKLKYNLATAAQNPNTLTALQPGESIAVSHQFAGIYNFASSGPGDYEILPSTLFYVVTPDGAAEPIHAVLENSHRITIAENAHLAASRLFDTLHGTVTKRASFSGCSSSEISQINSAVPAAASYVSAAISYLYAHTASTTRFTTWFGSFTSSHHSIILSHFNNLTSPGSYTGWEYDCACTEGDEDTFAYVFPDQYGLINLCPRFWRAPTTGTNSKAGTLVHESTHFDATAATQDWAYGHMDCEALARSNSAEAIENADSHEYFAENNPALA